mgnify:CR=1 FL=1
MPSPYPGIALAGLETHRWHVHAIQCAPQNRHHVGSGPTHRHTSNTFITPRRTAPDVSDMSADISSNTPMTMARPAFHNRHCHCCRSTPKAMRRQRHSRCAGWARRRRSAAAERTMMLQTTASAASVHWRSTSQPRHLRCASSLPRSRREPCLRFGDCVSLSKQNY